MDVTVSDPMVGRLLDGRYLIGPRIARGGMATVYQAHDARLDRTVAVKVMHAGYAEDQTFVRRFVREARAAASLSDSGVVAVFDQGEDDGVLFLAMEYVPGATLRQVIAQQAPLPPGRALGYLARILSALASAHDAGIVHLDIKPENVLITDDDTVKVADFGLARAVSASSSTATQGLLIGTVSYLAPEQVLHGNADGRSDIYAAGIVAYEMLTGHKPYDGDSPIHVAYRHAHENVPPPSQQVPGIPPYLDGLVLRATARDPAERPSDTRLFLQQARRAKESIERGLADDPELTEDLTLIRRGLSGAPAGGPPIAGPPIAGPPDQDAAHTTQPVTPAPAEHTLIAPRDEADPPTTGHPAAAGVPAEHPGHPGNPGHPKHPGHPENPGQPRSRITSRRKGLIALVLVLLLAAGAGTAAWYYGIGRFTDVPTLTGMAPGAAEQELAGADLDLDVAGREYHEVIEPGQIVRTEPGADDRAVRGSAVTAWISQGPERYPVPELGDVTLDQAERLAAGTDLRLGTVSEEYSETVAEGKVISFEPDAGTELAPDSPINVVVSLGREPIEVPNVVGDGAEDAAAAIEDADLVADRSTAHSDDVRQGQVISQDPTDGTLFRGDTVSYVVSEGPELIEVPSVIRSSVADAEQALTDAGFDVQVEHSDVHVGLDVVISQNPRGGETAPRGSTIVITTV